MKVGLLEVLNIIGKFFNFKSKYFQNVNSKARCVQCSSSSMYKVFDVLIERYEVPFSFKYKWFSFRIFLNILIFNCHFSFSDPIIKSHAYVLKVKNN